MPPNDQPPPCRSTSDSTAEGPAEPLDDPRGDDEVASRASRYPLSRLAPNFDLVDVAREIQSADRMLGAVVGGQLDVIAEQIRALQARARTILRRAERAGELHRADCNFPKRPGHVYHLYRRRDDAPYLSLLSPEEWGGRPPHAFEGSYRLELDMGWTRVDAPEPD